MKVMFVSTGWRDYMFWQNTDRAIVKRINRLIDDIGDGTRSTASASPNRSDTIWLVRGHAESPTNTGWYTRCRTARAAM